MTKTGEGPEKLVVDVPPCRMKPDGVKSTVTVVGLYPGIVSVMVADPLFTNACAKNCGPELLAAAIFSVMEELPTVVALFERSSFVGSLEVSVTVRPPVGAAVCNSGSPEQTPLKPIATVPEPTNALLHRAISELGAVTVNVVVFRFDEAE